ncbi:MAG: hypothetical protein ACTHJ1_05280 [Bordetella sp.]|uniref:hypothetical protein n=1 Tax=Bordetella sp. TaxID=28081 RepID=UPI003F7C213C
MATQALQVKQRLLSQAQSCEAHYGENGRAFRFVEFFWEGDYFEVLHGAALVFAALPASKRAEKEQEFLEQDRQIGAAASKRDENGWKSTCGDLYNRLVDKERHKDAFDKATQKRMSEIYAHSGTPPFARRDNDYTDGCMKAQYNHGLRDFDTIRKVCSCVTDAMTSSATSEQLKALNANPKTLTSQPWFPLAAPKFNACRALWGANPH